MRKHIAEQKIMKRKRVKKKQTNLYTECIQTIFDCMKFLDEKQKMENLVTKP